MKKRIIFVYAGISTFLFFSLALSQEIKKDFHQSYDVEEGVTLHLRHGDGDVTITPWDKDKVDITVRYRATFRIYGIGSTRDFNVDFRQSGDDIYVTGKERNRGGIVIGVQISGRQEYTYDIKAPDYAELDFHGDDGEVKIEDWAGDISCVIDDGDIRIRNIQSEMIKLRSDDGGIRIQDLVGELYINIDDGDVFLADCQTAECRITGDDGEISLRRCKGSFQLKIDDGDIEFNRVQARSLDIRSDDGDIDISLLKSDRLDVDIISDNGYVIIDLEEGMSATFSLVSDDGRIRVDLPEVENFKKGRHHKSGETYGGWGRIKVRTEDGDITLREMR